MDTTATSNLSPASDQPIKTLRLRSFVILLVLMVLLLGMIALSRLVADWHYVLSAETGEVLYAATFDDLLEDWGQYQGRVEAQVVDSKLSIKAETSNAGPFSVTRQHFGDFDYRVQATVVEGPLDNGFGMIFRLQDKGNQSLADDSYYLFLVSSDGYYRVLRVVDGQQKELSMWIPSPFVHQGLGVMNNLRVVAVSNQFQFYVNDHLLDLCIPDNPDGFSTYNDMTETCIGGQMLDTLVDDSLASGQLGVAIITLNEPNVTVEFDNVLVLGAS